jgi:peptide-methionine (S)-S-oxide reductase
MRRPVIAVAALVPFAALLALGSRSSEAAPRAAVDEHPAAVATLETAYFAGGCFWGVEAVFEHVRGVTDVVSGYSGGTVKSPEYETVSSGSTGHAESVKVTYDPSKVSYGELLRVFFSVAHDPTELNRQGPDVGTQYRSAIFYANEAQHQVASAYIDQLAKAHTFKSPIVTQVVPFQAFYPAEAYHQDFMVHHPDYPYIVINDRPKVEHLKKGLPELYVERNLAAR